MSGWWRTLHTATDSLREDPQQTYGRGLTLTHIIRQQQCSGRTPDGPCYRCAHKLGGFTFDQRGPWTRAWCA